MSVYTMTEILNSVVRERKNVESSGMGGYLYL